MANPLIGQRIVTAPVGSGSGTNAPAAGLIIDAYLDLVDAQALVIAALSSAGLVAGTNITLTTLPSGQIQISASGGGGGGAPSFGAVVIASTLLATQNNFNNNGAVAPNAWSNLVTKVRHTPLTGGSIITGFDATGFVDGQPVQHVNGSTTDIITITHQDPLSLTANRVRLPNSLAVDVAPGAGLILYRDNGTWIYA